nr:hypothetical protein [Pantoea cypripedii]
MQSLLWLRLLGRNFHGVLHDFSLPDMTDVSSAHCCAGRDSVVLTNLVFFEAS